MIEEGKREERKLELRRLSRLGDTKKKSVRSRDVPGIATAEQQRREGGKAKAYRGTCSIL